MQAEDIARKLKQTPFMPFRMYLTDGATFDVRHPEMLVLSRRVLIIGTASDPAERIAEQFVDIDLFHIVRIEDLTPVITKSEK